LTGKFLKSLFCICSLLLIPTALQASDVEITPFRTTNQSPLVVIHALPADSSSTITSKGRFSTAFTFDLASNYTFRSLSNESILLDGESYRWTLSTRYGLIDRMEIGLDIPYMLYGGGVLDSFIVGWHDAFGLPQGGRKNAPKNRLRYSYSKDGAQKLLIDQSGNGIGDLTLTTGVKLYESGSPSEKDTLALRATVKLPTGDSDLLLGDGAFSGTGSLCGGINSFTEWGTVGLFGSAGVMLSGEGKVLNDQQKNLAGFGTLGLGWGPLSWISFKVQLNANTPLYGDSNLTQLSRPGVMFVSGGALKIPGDYILDIGVSEDVAVATAPDVSLHLALSRQF
jgi:Protein of unknown function (DUF3187)